MPRKTVSMALAQRPRFRSARWRHAAASASLLLLGRLSAAGLDQFLQRRHRISGCGVPRASRPPRPDRRIVRREPEQLCRLFHRVPHPLFRLGRRRRSSQGMATGSGAPRSAAADRRSPSGLVRLARFFRRSISGLIAMPDPIRLGTDRIQAGNQARIPLFDQEHERLAADRLVLAGRLVSACSTLKTAGDAATGAIRRHRPAVGQTATGRKHTRHLVRATVRDPAD